MTPMIRSVLVCWLLSLASLGGCGNDRGDDDDGDSACEAAGHAICDRACDCRDGDGCGVTDSTGGVTLGFDSLSDCEGLYITLGCSGGGDETIDLEACASDMPDAECSGTGEDAAVAVPASCESEE